MGSSESKLMDEVHVQAIKRHLEKERDEARRKEEEATKKVMDTLKEANADLKAMHVESLREKDRHREELVHKMDEKSAEKDVMTEKLLQLKGETANRALAERDDALAFALGLPALVAAERELEQLRPTVENIREELRELRKKLDELREKIASEEDELDKKKIANKMTDSCDNTNADCTDLICRLNLSEHIDSHLRESTKESVRQTQRFAFQLTGAIKRLRYKKIPITDDDLSEVDFNITKMEDELMCVLPIERGVNAGMPFLFRQVILQVLLSVLRMPLTWWFCITGKKKDQERLNEANSLQQANASCHYGSEMEQSQDSLEHLPPHSQNRIISNHHQHTSEDMKKRSELASKEQEEECRKQNEEVIHALEKEKLQIRVNFDTETAKSIEKAKSEQLRFDHNNKESIKRFEETLRSVQDENEREFHENRRKLRAQTAKLLEMLRMQAWSSQAESYLSQRLASLKNCHVPVHTRFNDLCLFLRHKNESSGIDLSTYQRVMSELALLKEELVSEIAVMDDEVVDMRHFEEAHPEAGFLTDIKESAGNVAEAAKKFAKEIEKMETTMGSCGDRVISLAMLNDCDWRFENLEKYVAEIPTIMDLKLKYKYQ